MMVLQSCEELTPEYSSKVLRECGLLQFGQVMAVACSDEAFNRGTVSNIARVSLTYSSDARGELPESVFLKMSKPYLHPELLNAGRHEVEFYSIVREKGYSLPIPQIYSAEVNEENQSHLILQDLSFSHIQKPLPIPPSLAHCERIVEALGRLHAAFWNSPELGEQIGARHTYEGSEAVYRRLYDSFPNFVDYLGDALLPQQKRLFEQILASDFLQRLTRRLVEQDRVTLVHGDAHTGNILLPREEFGDAVLIDWQRYAIDLGTLDIAFLIALHWSPARRAAFERDLIRRYYDTLVSNGVANYTWDDCWNDYRREVIIMMLVPIGQHRRGSAPGVVWFGLQDSWAAVEDLHCGDLL